MTSVFLKWAGSRRYRIVRPLFIQPQRRIEGCSLALRRFGNVGCWSARLAARPKGCACPRRPGGDAWKSLGCVVGEPSGQRTPAESEHSRRSLPGRTRSPRRRQRRSSFRRVRFNCLSGISASNYPYPRRRSSSGTEVRQVCEEGSAPAPGTLSTRRMPDLLEFVMVFSGAAALL